MSTKTRKGVNALNKMWYQQHRCIDKQSNEGKSLGTANKKKK